MKKLKKLAIYLLGLMIIALGINISKLSSLGISPVSSIPGVLHAIYPAVSLGSMVIVVYCLLVLAQLVVLRKKFQLQNLLGVPVALIFGILVDALGTEQFRLTLAGIDLGIPGTYSGIFCLLNIGKPETLFAQVLCLLASIVVIAIGVYIYLQPKLVPMPAEGLAQAISRVTGKPFGNCKTCVDVGLIAVAALLQVIFLGGFASFGIGKGIVGIGTVLSAACVGQVVKALARAIGKLQKPAGAQ